MSITGNLKTMQLAELLQWLSQSNKTGTLVIDNRDTEKKIYFKGGRVISSASTDPNEHLGHFLVSQGLIDEDELSKAIEMQERTGMLLGKILVTIGALEEETLHKLLQRKAQESVYDLFTWAEGDFRFLDGDKPKGTMIPIDLDTTALILEGIRRVDEWMRIREYIPTPQAIPVSLTDLDDPGLSPSERQILSKVDDNRTVEEICLETHSSEFHVCKVLLTQIEAQRIKVVKPRRRAAADPAGDDGIAVGAKSLLAGAESHLGQKRFENALRHLRAAKSLEPENRQVQEAAQQGEARIQSELEKEGIVLDAVPKLSSDLEDLTASKISPQEGFMLTRINGSYDIRSIVKISPMPQLEALLVFWRLHKAGHITLEKAAKRPAKAEPS
jgi:hypothetical protein